MCNTHGHTLRGLYKTYGKQHDSRMADLFISEIYTKDIYDELQSYVTSKEFIEQNQDFIDICNTCQSHNMPIYLFSNAPGIWCDTVVTALNNINNQNIDTTTPALTTTKSIVNGVYSSNHKIMYPYYFKPDAEVYTNILKDIDKNIYAENINEYIFIDDSLINLRPVYNNDSWTPVLFDNGDIPQKRLYNDNIIKTVKNMNEVKVFIDKKIKHASIAQPTCNLYLVHNEIKNIASTKMVLRSCIPYLSEFVLEQIIMNANNTGKGYIATCIKNTALKYTAAMRKQGLIIEVETN